MGLSQWLGFARNCWVGLNRWLCINFGGCGLLLMGINFGGCGLLLLFMVASDRYLAMICLVGWDLAGFGFGISVWCSNDGFGGLVWCFNMSLVVEERDRDEEMREKSTVFYIICFVVYIILLSCM